MEFHLDTSLLRNRWCRTSLLLFGDNLLMRESLSKMICSSRVKIRTWWIALIKEMLGSQNVCWVWGRDLLLTARAELLSMPLCSGQIFSSYVCGWEQTWFATNRICIFSPWKYIKRRKMSVRLERHDESALELLVIAWGVIFLVNGRRSLIKSLCRHLIYIVRSKLSLLWGFCLDLHTGFLAQILKSFGSYVHLITRFTLNYDHFIEARIRLHFWGRWLLLFS